MSSQSFVEIGQLETLINEGQRLQQSPKSNKILQASSDSKLAIPVTTLIERWIEKSISLIYSLLPKTIINSDLNRINDVFSRQNDKIIQHNSDDISIVIDSLQTCLDFFRWLTNFDDKVLDRRQQANFHFGPLHAIVNYLDENLVPELMGLEDGKTKKTAKLHLYGRIYAWALGIVKLNEVGYCQLLGASLRSMLELYIDFALIDSDLIDNALEKFFVFDMAHRYWSAKKLLDIDKELGKPERESSALRNHLIDGDQKEENIRSIWGTKRVLHWSGMKVEDRARKAGLLDIHRDVYYYGNMFIHSGYIGSPNTEEDAHLLCAHVYALSAMMLKDTSLNISDESNIEHKDDVKKEIEDLYLIYGYFQVWKSWVNSRLK
ncbi:MAG: DUF5677 domain-containing protein [Phycisphaerae bacterium]|nr:DUF5677 domain-containing protein [Phycisphaerae bacterium]